MPDPRFRVVRTGGYEVIEVDELIDQIELGLSKSPPGISTQQIESAAFTPARRHGYASQEVDAWLDLVLAELRSRADGTVTSHRPPDGPSGFSSAEKTAVQPRAVDRPPSSVGSAAGDQLILRSHEGVARWVMMLVVGSVAVAVILVLYFSGVFS